MKLDHVRKVAKQEGQKVTEPELIWRLAQALLYSVEGLPEPLLVELTNYLGFPALRADDWNTACVLAEEHWLQRGS